MADIARFSVSKFKELIAKEGSLSRGVWFNCTITHPNPNFQFDESHSFLCKAANLPTTQLDVTELKYFTRSVKIPAAKQYAPITLTFYNTNSYTLRNQFLKWISVFNTPVSNLRNAIDLDDAGQSTVTIPFTTDVSENYAKIVLIPHNEKHEEMAAYRFSYAFPTSVSGLQYSYENDSQVQTYDVEFQYLYATFAPTIDVNTFF